MPVRSIHHHRLPLLLLFSVTVLGSEGDRDSAFQHCLATTPRPRIEDRIYECGMAISISRKERNLPQQQYFGHWAYLRLLAMQEPAACLFSLANMIPHILHLCYARRERKRGERNLPSSFFFFHASEPSPLLLLLPRLLHLYPYIHLNAWLCSALYHANKTHLTTVMDYAAAFLLMSFSVFLAASKLFYSYACYSSYSNSSYHYNTLSTSAFLGLSAVYLTALFRGRVAHGEHMTLCIALAVIHSILWLLWLLMSLFHTPSSSSSLPSSASSSFPPMSSRMICLGCNIWFAGAALFELLDFPPLFFILDAHAVWHLLTVPLGFAWYVFWELEHPTHSSSSKVTEKKSAD